MRISLILLAMTTLSGGAFAQAPASPPAPDAAPAAVYDPQQFPAMHGELERFTLGPRGDIDGLILKDGTEVKTAPDLGAQLAIALKPGDRVTVRGLKAAALPLVRAVSITDESTRRTVSESAQKANPPPPPPPDGTAPARGTPRETTGTVRMTLHGPQGEVNGVLLENGAILRFPPDSAGPMTAALQPHLTIVAEGVMTTNALGTVVEVQQIGPSRERLVAVGPTTPSADDRGPARLRRPVPPTPPAQGAPPPPSG